MMIVKRTAIVLAGAFGLPVLTALPAAADPIPDGVSVDVVGVNGSGCLAGTSSVVMSKDKTSFTVTYSDFVVYAGGDAPPSASRKNCHITVRVNGADDYSYSVLGVNHRGFARLEMEATGEERTHLYFQGGSYPEPIGRTFQGQYIFEWQSEDWVSPRAMVWKPCGEDRDLNINTELRVKAEGSGAAKTSLMSMDATNSSARYLFVWRHCP
ncbi:DUF4360 domain-containing protein [Actinomadura syzygii]|uniref:DUF4360 domain-containing protein n=1 Tax=Actinomadura syzygii TaxID=1427538 RepID=A0A5D0U6B1_9ACTN|nr:DUF4360 domain-containing protein [Actinomadura syzygii]TYC13263.1 DUF4360 domain-containing protein [Actinomadura syzygii]